MLNIPTKVVLRETILRKRSALGLYSFLDNVSIELADKEVRKFRDVREGWQDALLAPLIQPIEHIAGLHPDSPPHTGPRKFYLTLPKSHAKTTKIGLLAVWALCFARRQVRLMAAAADQKQARFLLEAIKMIRRENPFLRPLMDLVLYEARSRNIHQSLLTVESSEASTKSGALVDIIILDELCFWSNTKGKELFDTLLNTTVKRPQTVFIIITNAGIKGSWQHKLLEQAKADQEEWYVSDEPGRRASWLRDKDIATVRATVLPSLARRVFDNTWTEPFDLEDSYLVREQIQSCIDHELLELPA